MSSMSEPRKVVAGQTIQKSWPDCSAQILFSSSSSSSSFSPSVVSLLSSVFGWLESGWLSGLLESVEVEESDVLVSSKNGIAEAGVAERIVKRGAKNRVSARKIVVSFCLNLFI